MRLIRYELDEENFYKILDYYQYRVEEVNDLGQFIKNGYSDKETIKYNPNSDTFICQGYYINHIYNRLLIDSPWKQIICKLNTNITADEVKELRSGQRSFNIIKKVILKKYKLEEFTNILLEHQGEIPAWDEQVIAKQTRLLPLYEKNVVHHFHNCVYYDINGAHRDAVFEMFPKAKELLLKEEKQDINSFVGYLKRVGYETTMWWVIRRTRAKLDKIIKDAGGIEIYSNTDGVVLAHPEHYLQTSNKIGEFKSEMMGDDIYVFEFKDDPKLYTGYSCIQYIDKDGKRTIKGTVPVRFRSEMNLAQGHIVRYKKRTTAEHNVYYENVTIIKKEIKEYE